MTWIQAMIAKLFVSSADTLVSCALPSTTVYPTGCCIHEFAVRIR